MADLLDYENFWYVIFYKETREYFNVEFIDGYALAKENYTRAKIEYDRMWVKGIWAERDALQFWYNWYYFDLKKAYILFLQVFCFDRLGDFIDYIEDSYIDYDDPDLERFSLYNYYYKHPLLIEMRPGWNPFGFTDDWSFRRLRIPFAAWKGAMVNKFFPIQWPLSVDYHHYFKRTLVEYPLAFVDLPAENYKKFHDFNICGHAYIGFDIDLFREITRKYFYFTPVLPLMLGFTFVLAVGSAHSYTVIFSFLI